MSETAVCRERLAQYCQGAGVDLGFGGDPITPNAITVDMEQPYTNVGLGVQQLRGDARNLHWFKDRVLDFVYSSHLLEDFPPNETVLVLQEWLRVLKPGGYLVIFCPDEQIFRKHCKETGQGYNNSHSVDNFSLKYLKKRLDETGIAHELVHEIHLINTYSFDLVIRKL